MTDVLDIDRRGLEFSNQGVLPGSVLPEPSTQVFDTNIYNLTVRGFQVANLRSRGLTSQETGEALGISQTSVTRHSSKFVQNFDVFNFEHGIFHLARLGAILPPLVLAEEPKTIDLIGTCIVYLAGQGKTDSEIAKIRGISREAVLGHKKAVKDTWQTRNNAQMIRTALQFRRILPKPLEDFESVEEAMEALEELYREKPSAKSSVRFDETDSRMFTLRENRILNLLPYGIPVAKAARILHLPLSFAEETTQDISNKLGAVNFKNAVYMASGEEILSLPPEMPNTTLMSMNAAHSLYLQAQGLELEEVAEVRGLDLEIIEAHQREAYEVLGVNDELSAIRLGVHANKIPFPAVDDQEMLSNWLIYLNPKLTLLQADRLARISFGETVAEIVKEDKCKDMSVSRNFTQSLFGQLKVSGAEEAVRRGFALGYLRPSRKYTREEIPEVKRDLLLLLDLVSSGHSLKHVERTFNLPKIAVYRMQKKLLEALGAENLPHATRIAIEMGILPTEYPKEFTKNSAMIRPPRPKRASSVKSLQ